MTAAENESKAGGASGRSLALSGLLLALAGAFLYSLKPIFIKLNYGYDIDAVTQLTLRMLLSLPFYVAIGLCAYRRAGPARAHALAAPRTLGKIAALGILGYYLSALLDMEGLGRVTAQFERLILFTYPTFVVLIGAMFFGEALGRAHVGALALTYLGLALVFVKDLDSFGGQVVSGTALVLLCAVTYALYLLGNKGLVARLGSALLTSASMVTSTLAILLHFLLTHELAALAVPTPVVWYSLGMAVLSTVIPSYLLIEALARIGPGPASVATGAGPVFTAALSSAILGEAFTSWHAAGMALVIGGILVLSRAKT